MCQNYHFRHIWQIHLSSIANFYGPPHCFVLCLVGKRGQNVIFAIFAKFGSIANFYEPPHCFVFCLVGKCGKIAIFAICAKFASIVNFYGPPYCFVFCLVGKCAKIVIFAIFAKFTCPVLPTFMTFLIALCFALLANVEKLSFSRYLPNWPVLPTFMGPLVALCLALLANVAKLSFSPYLPNSPVQYCQLLWAPSLLCALPCWRLWQYCHFRHIS